MRFLIFLLSPPPSRQQIGTFQFATTKNKKSKKSERAINTRESASHFSKKPTKTINTYLHTTDTMRIHQVILLISCVFTASVTTQANPNAGDASMEGSSSGSGSDWASSSSSGSGSDWASSGSGSLRSSDMSSSSGSWGSHSGSSGSGDFSIEAGQSGSSGRPSNLGDDSGAGVDKDSTSAPATVAPNTNSSTPRIAPVETTVACILIALVSAYFA